MERTIKGKRTLCDEIYEDFPSVYVSYGEGFQLYVNGESYGSRKVCGFRIDECDNGFRLFVDYLEE